MLFKLSVAALFLAQFSQLVHSQDPTTTTTADPWLATGSASFYWHNRYHGLLSMAAYGNYTQACSTTFTAASLQVQYPGIAASAIPFEVVGTWGPTPKYGSEGYMVKVPEMNKILMVFKGIYGWENFNATLIPYTGIGCDSTCKAHAGALEAWAEVKAATNDMQAIKDNQGNLVWSASGHGFGGMIAQVGALDLKYRQFLFSAQTFGSPPVFNQATATLYDTLFEGDASQRTVANEDSIPTKIPITNGSDYVFVNTGIHVFGTNPMYGQDYIVCEGNPWDPECGGGSNEADHYFYFTDLGSCGSGWGATYNTTFDALALASDQYAYNQTATAALLSVPNTSIIPATSTPSSSIVSSTSMITSTAVPTATSTTAVPAATTGASLRQNAAGVKEISQSLILGAVVVVGMGLGMGARFA